VESLRVLIVDDDPILLESLSAALSPTYCVLTARDSRAALIALVDEAIHLVLLDLVLGDEDGVALIPEIRARTSAPILLITGFGSHDNLVRSIRARPDDFLEKPFNLAELHGKMAALLGRPKTVETRLERVRAKIEREYATRLTLERLARASGMRPRELRAAFTARYGKTPHAYLVECRMRRAAGLVAGGRGLKEVAGEVGYGSASNFSVAFRRHHGLAPRVYRAKGGVQGK
jgi:DNA-binding response OmpR family regulator